MLVVMHYKWLVDGMLAVSGTTTFPFTFVNLPTITATINNNVSGLVSVYVYNITTTGFSWSKYYYNPSNGQYGGAVDNFYWIALG